MKKYPLILLFCSLLVVANAQNPGPRPGGQGRDPAKMIAMEKQMLLDSIAGINTEQKLIIDQIYVDYEASLLKMREEMQNSGDREAMREQMMGIREGKEEALKAIFTAEQYSEYERLMKEARERMRERGRTRRGDE